MQGKVHHSRYLSHSIRPQHEVVGPFSAQVKQTGRHTATLSTCRHVMPDADLFPTPASTALLFQQIHGRHSLILGVQLRQAVEKLYGECMGVHIVVSLYGFSLPKAYFQISALISLRASSSLSDGMCYSARVVNGRSCLVVCLTTPELSKTEPYLQKCDSVSLLSCQACGGIPNWFPPCW